MLKAVFHKNFKKEYQKLPPKIREAFNERIRLFVKNPKNSVLKDHKLSGMLKNKRAFSVIGDVRTIYEHLDKNTIKLLAIGTHSQVY